MELKKGGFEVIHFVLLVFNLMKILALIYIYKGIYIYTFILCVKVLPVLCVCAEPIEASRPLRLELYTTVSHNVCVGSQG